MVGQKVCKQCNMIYEGDKCPGCGSQEYGEEIKGKVIIFDTEKSEVAKNTGLTKKGLYSIKVR